MATATKKKNEERDDKVTEKSIDADFGDIPGLKMGSDKNIDEIRHLYSYDCPPLDIPFGGGIVAGRIYEDFGQESHGKSTMALEKARVFCEYWAKQKGSIYRVLWIESESTFDRVRASYMGCDLTKFMFFETDVFEDGRDRIKLALDKAVRNDVKLFIVWDTIAACATRKEKEANAEAAGVEEGDDDEDGKSKTNPGGMMEKPRLIKAMFRDITTSLGATQSTFIIVNQVNMAKKGPYSFGLDSTGGHALKHHASVRSNIYRVDDKTKVGRDGIAQVFAFISEISFVKNKITGFTKYKIPVWIDLIHGVDRIETRMLYLKSAKIIPTAVGGWYTMKIPAGYATKPTTEIESMIEIKFMGTGPSSFIQMLKKHPHMLDYLDFRTYQNFCADSPLVKVKNIDKLWAFEEKFHGQRITKLTPDEKNAADFMYHDLITKADIEVEAPEGTTTEVVATNHKATPTKKDKK